MQPLFDLSFYLFPDLSNVLFYLGTHGTSFLLTDYIEKDLSIKY